MIAKIWEGGWPPCPPFPTALIYKSCCSETIMTSGLSPFLGDICMRKCSNFNTYVLPNIQVHTFFGTVALADLPHPTRPTLRPKKRGGEGKGGRFGSFNSMGKILHLLFLSLNEGVENFMSKYAARDFLLLF